MRARNWEFVQILDAGSFWLRLGHRARGSSMPRDERRSGETIAELKAVVLRGV